MSGLGSARGECLLHFLVAAAATAAVFGAYHAVLGLGLLGYDAYPMILTARIQGLCDLAGAFTEELMDGRFPRGSFYRPVTSLSIALDHALWGLTPLGYHLTDLLVFAANGTLLFACARKLFGTQAWLAGLVASLLFVLHPIQLETLPVPPRRADSLCLGFTLACFLSTALADEAAPAQAGLRRALAALFALLAVASKETGAIAAPLVFGLAFLRSTQRDLAGRALDALRRGLPTIAAVAAFAAARTWVLGGAGGHRSFSLAQLLDAHGLFEPYLGRLLAPQQYEPEGIWMALLSLAALLLAVRLAQCPPARADARRLRAGLAFALLWFLCLLAVHSLADRVSAWYTSLFVAPYALFLGVLIELGVGALRERRIAMASLALAFALWFAASHVRYSSLLHAYPNWRRASDVADAFLADFESRVRSAEPGSTLHFRRFPIRVERPPEPPGIRSAVVLEDYSVQAWADLVMPEHPVRVRKLRRGPRPLPAPEAGALDVVLHPGVAGFDSGWRPLPARRAAPRNP